MDVKKRMETIALTYKLNRSEIAVKCGVSESSISKAVIANKISPKLAKAIAFNLNINFEWVLNGTGDMNSTNNELLISANKKYDYQTLEVFKKIKNPKEIKVQFPLLKNNGNAIVLVEASDIYDGEGVYAIEINGAYKICSVTVDFDGAVLLEGIDSKKTMSFDEFSQYKLIGRVVCFFKEII